MLAALVIAVAAAIVVVELRAGEPFGHGRHGDEWAVRFEDDFEGDALDGDAWNTCHWWDDGGCTISSNDELEWYLPSGAFFSVGAYYKWLDDVLMDMEFPRFNSDVLNQPGLDRSEYAFETTANGGKGQGGGGSGSTG